MVRKRGLPLDRGKLLGGLPPRSGCSLIDRGIVFHALAKPDELQTATPLANLERILSSD